MLKSVIPDVVEVNFTIDDIGLKSNLINNNTIKFTGESFFYTILWFTQNHSGPRTDIEGFVQFGTKPI